MMRIDGTIDPAHCPDLREFFRLAALIASRWTDATRLAVTRAGTVYVESEGGWILGVFDAPVLGTPAAANSPVYVAHIPTKNRVATAEEIIAALELAAEAPVRSATDVAMGTAFGPGSMAFSWKR